MFAKITLAYNILTYGWKVYKWLKAEDRYKQMRDGIDKVF